MFEIIYLRNIYDVRRMDGESNKSVYNKSDVSIQCVLMKCGVVDQAKCNTLGTLSTKKELQKVRRLRVYMSMIDAAGVKITSSDMEGQSGRVHGRKNEKGE